MAQHTGVDLMNINLSSILLPYDLLHLFLFSVSHVSIYVYLQTHAQHGYNQSSNIRVFFYIGMV